MGECAVEPGHLNALSLQHEPMQLVACTRQVRSVSTSSLFSSVATHRIGLSLEFAIVPPRQGTLRACALALWP